MRIVFLTLTNSAYSVKSLWVAEQIKNHWLYGRCVKEKRTFVRLYAVPKYRNRCIPASISTSCDGELFISNSLNVDRVESTFNMWRSQSMYINLRSFSNTLEEYDVWASENWSDLYTMMLTLVSQSDLISFLLFFFSKNWHWMSQDIIVELIHGITGKC